MVTDINIPKLEKREIKIIKSNYITDDDFDEQVNECLKDGWTILNTACAACVFFDKNMVTQRHTYTAIVYKETYK